MNPKVQRQQDDAGVEVIEQAAPAGAKGNPRLCHETH
jgi:hypothetical protein